MIHGQINDGPAAETASLQAGKRFEDFSIETSLGKLKEGTRNTSGLSVIPLRNILLFNKRNKSITLREC